LLAFAALIIAVAPGWHSAEALTNCQTDTAALNAGEQTVFEQLNAYRVANGVAPVKLSPNLSRAAAFMTEDLLAKGYWSHVEPSGRSPFQRAIDCGYPSQNVGENLAISFSGAGAVALWKTSPTHNANMLLSQWKVVGVGQAGGYWALDLGAVDDSGSTAAPGPGGTTVSPSPTASPTPSPTPTPGPKDPSTFPIRRALLQMVAAE
jgi:uncharacterized protein YkwD